jgi:DNA primase
MLERTNVAGHSPALGYNTVVKDTSAPKPSFSTQEIEKAKASADLVGLIGKRVTLTREGEEWRGLCPFHIEKTPSFSVVPKKGFYHCFGCGAHGDALT